jgi:hypothetical protein
MAFNIIKIVLEEHDRPLHQILKDMELKLSAQIVTNICEAIENNIGYVEIATITTPTQTITLKSEEPFYIDTLVTNMDTLIRYEEYELCSKAVKAIEVMTSRLEQSYLKDKKKYLENKKK